MTRPRRNPFPILIAATVVPAFVLAGLGVVTGEQRTSASESPQTSAISTPEPAIVRSVGLSELPWWGMLGWCVLTAGLWAAGHALWRQRAARQRAEELLRLGQVARLNTLGELAAGMAHELNQPLTALLSSTQASRLSCR